MNVFVSASDVVIDSERDIVWLAVLDTSSASDTDSDRDLDGVLDRLSDSETDSNSTAFRLLVS